MTRRYSVNLTNFGSGAAATSAVAKPSRPISGLFVGLYDGIGGPLLLDATPRLVTGEFVSDEHGYAEFLFSVEMELEEQFRLFDVLNRAYTVINWQGLNVYEGQIDSVETDDDALKLTAFGLQSETGLKEYIGVFTKNKSADLKAFSKEEFATFNKDLFIFDNDGRMYMALKKNAVYRSNNDALAVYWDVPSGSERLFTELVVGVGAYRLPPNWRIRLFASDADSLLSNTIISDQTSAGGTNNFVLYDWSFSATPRARVGLQVYNVSGTDFTNGQEDGYYYFQFPMFALTVAAGINAGALAGHMIDFVAGQKKLTSAKVLVDPFALYLFDGVYEDMTPAEILDDLAIVGTDEQAPVEWGVFNHRTLHFRKRGSDGRDLYIDVSSLKLRRTLAGLVNQTYAVYQDADGRTLRTAAASDVNSETVNNITVRRAVPVTTSNITVAEAARDTALRAKKDAVIQAQVGFSELFDAGQAVLPNFMARPGDVITARSLPLTSDYVQQFLRRFMLSETRYNLMTDELKITPENSTPDMTYSLAKVIRPLARRGGVTDIEKKSR